MNTLSKISIEVNDMMISTKGRYALRVMIDLAEHQKTGYTPLKDIAQRQNISLKYLESIMTVFSKNGFVEAVHGKGGGYRLNRDPSEYDVGNILKLIEGTIAPVACPEIMGDKCKNVDQCRTLSMWKKLNKMIDNYLSGITIADLMS